MMISPEMYEEGLAGKSPGELIASRDGLIESIRAFEAGDAGDSAMLRDPSPEVVYQMELLYLAKACERISEEYNRTVIWGDCGER